MRSAVIVDDHPMCRQATAMAFAAAAPDLPLIQSESMDDACRHAPHAAMITMDLALPDSQGLLGLSAFRDQFPDLPMLVISGTSHPDAEREVAVMGAQGFLSKQAPMSDLVAAIRTVLHHGRWFSAPAEERCAPTELERIRSLTAAQLRVLLAMRDGRLNKQIAHDLDLSEITVKAHVKAILKKLAAANRTHAMLMLARAEQ